MQVSPCILALAVVVGAVTGAGGDVVPVGLSFVFDADALSGASSGDMGAWADDVVRAVTSMYAPAGVRYYVAHWSSRGPGQSVFGAQTSASPTDALTRAAELRAGDPLHAAAHVTLVVTRVQLGGLQGVAWGTPGSAYLCAYPDTAVSVVREQSSETATHSLVAHELGHLWGLVHDDTGLPAAPNIMNAFNYGGTSFRAPALADLAVALAASTGSGCVRALGPARVEPVSWPVLGRVYAGHVRALVTLAARTGNEFVPADACTVSGAPGTLVPRTPYIAECAGPTTEPAAWGAAVTVAVSRGSGTLVDTGQWSVEPGPLFLRAECTCAGGVRVLTVLGAGLAGGVTAYYYGGRFPELVERSDTRAVLRGGPAGLVPPGTPLLYGSVPGAALESTGLAPADCCVGLPAWRCRADITCADNAAPGLCCSRYNWCGDTPAHCGAGCQSGPCFDPYAPACGDGVCDTSSGGGESCATCPGDCACELCGNGVVDPGENCAACPGDCAGGTSVCGNGVCEASETCAVCTEDCCPGTWRCSRGVTCAQNGLDEYCCSSGGWCGLSDAHCGAGCQSGPCK